MEVQEIEVGYCEVENLLFFPIRKDVERVWCNFIFIGCFFVFAYLKNSSQEIDIKCGGIGKICFFC